MINREFIEKRAVILEVEIPEIGEKVYVKKPTVLDIKKISSLKNEQEQGIATVQTLIVDKEGKKLFEKKDIEDMDIELFSLINKAIENSGAIPIPQK